MKRKPPSLDPPPRRRGRRALTAEERQLWAHVAQSARPLEGRSAPAIEPPPPAGPAAPPAEPVPKPAIDTPARPRLLPLAGVERKLLRELSRGQRVPDARIDLHGMRQSEAHQALLGFLHRQHAREARLLLVITGKGGPEGGLAGDRGVLRRMVPHWLADPALRRVVVGFEVAARAHGGEGALYVRLRRRREA